MLLHGFSVVAESRGCSLVAVRGLLTVAPPLVVEYRPQGSRASVVETCGLRVCGSWTLEHRFSSGGARPWLLHGMWNLPRSRIGPMSPSLSGGFFTTEPPGKPRKSFD